MGKQELKKVLSHPITNVTKIQERYDKIRQHHFEKRIYTDLSDQNQLLKKMQRQTKLHPKTFLQFYQQYHYLVSIYSEEKEIQEMLRYIDSQWTLEESLEQNGCPPYLKTEDPDYLEDKNQLENIVLELQQKGEEFDIPFTFVEEEWSESYYTITSKKYEKLSKENQQKLRVLSTKQSGRKVMFHELDNSLLKLIKLQIKLQQFEEQHYQTTKSTIFSRYLDAMINFNQKIATDSMYAVLKEFFTNNNYVQPTMSSSDTKRQECFFEIEKARHPLIEKIYSEEIFVPFSSHLDSNQKKGSQQGMLLFGENASGKSTFLRSIATCIWLAQCGLYCPCEAMHFKPYECLFSKLNHKDNLFKKESLFVNECLELQYILEKSHDHSTLLFLDELFQGSELSSTVGLICALVENLLHKKIQFIITSHIHLVGEIIEQQYPKCIRIQHFEVKKDFDILNTSMCSNSTSILHDRQLKEGKGERLYGCEVAQNLGMNKELIQTALTYRSHIDLQYTFKDEKKKSKYNKSIHMKECVLCKSRKELTVHHIVQQHSFENKQIEGFHKNAKQNLMVLCQPCHRRVEASFNRNNRNQKLKLES
jgi:DNA mismatch repair ATPase MutS